MLSFRGVCCHGHCAPWLWWEKEEVNLGMRLSALLQEVKWSKDALLDDGNKEGHMRESSASLTSAYLVFFYCSPTPLAIASKSSALLVLAEWLLLISLSVTRWSLHCFKKQQEPSEDTHCCDLLVYKWKIQCLGDGEIKKLLNMFSLKRRSVALSNYSRYPL